MTNRAWTREEMRDVEAINYYNEAIKTHEESYVMDKVRKISRDNARTPMQWDDSDYGGFSKENPWIIVNENYKDMNVNIKKPAEIALRSLEKKEQRKIIRALTELETSNADELFQNQKLHKLIVHSEEKLYSYLGTLKLRLILSIDDNQIFVEDILNHDRLERLLSSQRGKA
jgi:glycosidase